jgi:hypothetical protein
MTPQTNLAEQVSKEMDSAMAQLCRAIDNEREENLFRMGCREDCKEHLGVTGPTSDYQSLGRPALNRPRDQ